MLAETRSEPFLDFSELQPEPNPGFEGRLDVFAEKVADIDVNLHKGLETLVENVQTTPVQTPSKKAISKRKISPKQVPKQGPAEDEPEDPNSKKAAPTTSKLAKFLHRSVVRGKIVNVTYFQEQGLEVFLDKLRAHG